MLFALENISYELFKTKIFPNNYCQFNPQSFQPGRGIKLEKSFAPVLRIESIPCSISLTGNIQLLINDIYCDSINNTQSQDMSSICAANPSIINSLLNSNQGVIL